MINELKYILLIFVILFIVGCKTTFTVSTKYLVEDDILLADNYNRQLNLYLEPVKGQLGKLWYQLGDYKWYLEEDPVDLVRDGLIQELQILGISVASDRTEKEQNRLKAEIRWFGPYGQDYLTSAIIISLELYPKGSDSPIWRDKLEAGTQIQGSQFSLNGNTRLVEQIVSDTLIQALRQIRWNAEFRQAIEQISRDGT